MRPGIVNECPDYKTDTAPPLVEALASTPSRCRIIPIDSDAARLAHPSRDAHERRVVHAMSGFFTERNHVPFPLTLGFSGTLPIVIADIRPWVSLRKQSGKKRLGLDAMEETHYINTVLKCSSQ